MFIVSNGKSDHSVLKFKEQHTSVAVVAQSYSEHASQDMTWLSAAVQSWLTHDCTAIGHRLGLHMLRICDVDSSDDFTKDVSRRYRAVVCRAHDDQLIRYNFVNHRSAKCGFTDAAAQGIAYIFMQSWSSIVRKSKTSHLVWSESLNRICLR